jgi:hypothetical protein
VIATQGRVHTIETRQQSPRKSASRKASKGACKCASPGPTAPVISEVRPIRSFWPFLGRSFRVLCSLPSLPGAFARFFLLLPYAT